MRKTIIIFLIILCCLLFAWWAAGEVYNPRPTPPAITQIVLPPKATATDMPAVTAIVPVTEIVVVTEAPVQPTATQTPIPQFTPWVNLTYTQTPTQTIISTPVLSRLFPNDNKHECKTVRYNVFGIINRNSICAYTDLYRIP